MNCPKCGNSLDTVFNCPNCGYKQYEQQESIRPELTKADVEIEEMAKVLFRAWVKCPREKCPEVRKDLNSCDYCKCELLYAAGYRKESDIEKTIESSIQAEIANAGTSCHWCMAKTRRDAVKEFAEKAFALCCKHHYSIATRNNQRGMGMFTEGFEQVLSETAADLAAQFGKTTKHIQRGELMTAILEYLEDLYNSGNLSDEEWLDLKNLVEEVNNETK